MTLHGHNQELSADSQQFQENAYLFSHENQENGRGMVSGVLFCGHEESYTVFGWVEKGNWGG